MNVPDTLDVPQGLPNIPILRAQAVARIWDDPLAEWTDRELDALGDLVAHHAQRYVIAHRPPGNDWRACEGLFIVNRDLEDGICLPKWVALASWLAPESAVGSAPAFILELTSLVLSGRLAAYHWSPFPPSP